MVDLKKPKFPFEIDWPLEARSSHSKGLGLQLPSPSHFHIFLQSCRQHRQTDTHTSKAKKNSISFLFVDINKISPMNRIEQMKMAISYKDETAKSAQRQESRVAKGIWVGAYINHYNIRNLIPFSKQKELLLPKVALIILYSSIKRHFSVC